MGEGRERKLQESRQEEPGAQQASRGQCSWIMEEQGEKQPVARDELNLTALQVSPGGVTWSYVHFTNFLHAE